ncbi:hypothetical protein DN069_27610 [Streptacidiphilus pinicola]|uniref:Uncharacterized protein n=1 Tax=Streptacidiphilus pinicola TaxID=2219663 RepID=A0A2X0ID44_9ACTN|nr:hypothetical protein [Streptacidiphilus pinicola]RAG82437.1 hypothetical protein DN069_27610 [Streptacidiphilus pinicola]
MLPLKAETGPVPPPDLLDAQRLYALFDRVGRRGPGPMFQAAVLPHGDAAAREAARERLLVRLDEPLEERFRHQGLEQAR